jgi:Undecaprenyl-phosphate glucose phosphotransferase
MSVTTKTGGPSAGGEGGGGWSPAGASAARGAVVAADRRPIFCRLAADGVALADAAILAATGAAAFAFYFAHSRYGLRTAVLYALAVVAATLIYVLAAQAQRAYAVHHLTDLPRTIWKAGLALAVTVAIWLVVAFVTKTSGFWSRGWFLLWLGSSAVLIVLLRGVVALKVGAWCRSGRWQDRVVVVGANELGARVFEQIDGNPHAEAVVVGLFDERKPARVASFERFPVLGDLDSLFDFVRDNHVDAIFLALPWTDEGRIMRLWDRLEVLPVDIYLVIATSFIHRLYRGNVLSYGVAAVPVARRPLTGRQLFAKRAEDVILGGLITLAVSPLLALIALAIRLESPGPVLFRQPRHGYKDTIFQILKFRTMYADRSDPTGRARTVRGDPRITRIGGFLRRWSLDELPQLFNVLAGDMSLIGPRPHPVDMMAAEYEYRAVVPKYTARHRMKPGMTGRAQVAGYRGAADTVEKACLRVEHDLSYIAEWSIFEDFRILAKTAWAVVKGDEAY